MTFLQIGQITIEVSVLVLVITAIKFLLKKRLTPSAGYFLWIFVALRILVPFRIGLIPNFLETFGANQIGFLQQEAFGEEADQVVTKKDEILQDPVKRTEHKEMGQSIEEPERKEAFFSGKGVYCVWLSGSLLMAAYVLWLNARLSVTLKAKRKYIGMLKPDLPLYDMEGYNCLAGVFFPAVYVDIKGLGQRKIIEDVIQHELQHYRIRDNFWQLLRIVSLVLQWHNPFVWWAYASSRRDCELACDFRVFRGMTAKERYQYGRSLLAVAEVMRAKRSAAYIATSAGDSKRFMERRIVNIMEYKRKKIALGLAAVITVFLMLLCFASFREPLGEARGETGNVEEPQVSSGDGRPEKSDGPDEPSTFYKVSWEGEVFDSDWAPAGFYESLNTLVWMAHRGGDILAEDMSEEEDVYIVESSRILEDSDEVEHDVWVRIVQEPFVPESGSIGQVAHKDYIFYKKGEDAYIGVQSPENNKLWTIIKMGDYGSWLEKEIRMYIRMTTGL